MQETYPKENKSVSLGVVLTVALFVSVFTPNFYTAASGPTDYLRLALGGAGSAFLISTCGWLVGLIPLLPAYLIAWLMSGSPIAALGALAIVPPAVGFALVFKRRLSRFAAVSLVAAVYTLTVFLFVSLPVLDHVGTLSLDAFKATYPAFFEALQQAMRDAFTVTLAGQNIPFFTEENALAYVEVIVSMLPGVVVMLSYLLAYFSGTVYHILLSVTRAEKPLPTLWKQPPMPLLSALFVISVVLSVLADFTHPLWMISANLMMALFFPLFMLGLTSIFEIRLVDGAPRPRLLRTVLLFVTMLSGAFIPLLLCLIFGLYDSIRSLFVKPPAASSSNQP